MVTWSLTHADEAYGVPYWGSPYFSIATSGQIQVHPKGAGTATCELGDLVSDLVEQGFRPPLLLRFPDIIAERLHLIRAAFMAAISAHDYQGSYRGAYPIKVNQQRGVLDAVLRHSSDVQGGLEAGSKPELMIAMALQKPGGLILCNGFKDAEYLRTALHAQALGLDVIVVIERLDELPLLLELAQQADLRPTIGLRARLRGKGSGKWAASSGDRSKFGLTAAELLSAIDCLSQADRLDCLGLLHFHVGSQLTVLEPLEQALQEASRLFLELKSLGANQLSMLDIGGGLAVDYDGSQSDAHISMAYSPSDYATCVIGTVTRLFDACGQDHPQIITEAGRASVAHHSLLVIEAIAEDGTLHQRRFSNPAPNAPDALMQLVNRVKAHEAGADEKLRLIMELQELTLDLFKCGAIDLTTRAWAESAHHSALDQLRRTLRDQDHLSMHLAELDNHLAETWYANFSLFQSLPDHWAIDHDFPIVPLQRLDERPTQRVHLGDMTCDSDGEIRRFVGSRGVTGYLPAHALDDRPYYLGIFLVGAYQEILGDLHNLFGDTDTVEIQLTDDGFAVTSQRPGNSIADVLASVGYTATTLQEAIDQTAKIAQISGKLTLSQAQQISEQYRRDLNGYTYLEPTEHVMEPT